jgi:hypothetical protein
MYLWGRALNFPMPLGLMMLKEANQREVETTFLRLLYRPHKILGAELRIGTRVNFHTISTPTEATTYNFTSNAQQVTGLVTFSISMSLRDLLF